MFKKDLQPWDRFGRLVITWVREKRKRGWYEKCRCECWNEKWILRKSLFNWDARSCWCFQREFAANLKQKHWRSRERIYKIFKTAKARCYRKTHISYKNYWGRWIKVLWDNFEDFYRDMWESYEEHVKQFWEKNTTLDRIDSKKDYCKENCKRSTYREQQNNKRTNHKVAFEGRDYTSIAELSRALWLSYSTVRRRIKYNLKLL